MYIVKSSLFSEIKNELSSIDDEHIVFNHTKVIPFVLVWLKDKGKYSRINYTPINKDDVGIEINSYINIMNYDYKGDMELWLYLGSTNVNEQKRILKSRNIPTYGRLEEIFSKCPKNKGKITLVFNSNSKTDAGKISNTFSNKLFNIHIQEVKHKPTDKLVKSFSKLGYEIV